jgi:hypothetical protein
MINKHTLMTINKHILNKRELAKMGCNRDSWVSIYPLPMPLLLTLV